MIDIIVPTFGRPKAVGRIVENLKTVMHLPYNLLFLVERVDHDTIREFLALTYTKFVVGNFKSYANAFNCGYMLTDNPFVFWGSDDIEFTWGWDTEATNLLQNPNVHVVGVNSSGQPNDRCNLQFLFRRKYVEDKSLVVGSPNLPAFPYYHNFVDTELNWTARNRGIFQPCVSSIVKHLRPDTDTDDTYKKNNSTGHLDRETYLSRKHLFNGV